MKTCIAMQVFLFFNIHTFLPIQMPMQQTLSHQLATHMPNQTDFLVGLSGGIDSVVLLDLMRHQPNINVRAVHIHHGLSPNADHWADFCHRLCEQHHIPFELRKVEVSGKNGVESNARQARYQAVGETIRPNEVFVTAHHLDDQAETVLLALKRGSGIKGLAAMQAVGFWQNFAIFRPLLNISKAEITAYAEHRNLTWITDESNADNRYDRNFLRNQILPALNQRFPAFNQMLARTAQHCAEQQALIEELLENELHTRLGTENQLNIHGFDAYSPLKQQQLLRLWLARNRVQMPSQAQLQAVISSLIFAKPDRNPQVVLGGHIIRRFRQTLFVINNANHTPTAEIHTIPPLYQGELGTFSLQRNGVELLFCKKSGEIDRLLLPNALYDQPLTLQFAPKGKVKQYGKPHREEMKKIWQANNIPVWAREQTPVLFYHDQLVLVLPL